MQCCSHCILQPKPIGLAIFCVGYLVWVLFKAKYCLYIYIYIYSSSKRFVFLKAYLFRSYIRVWYVFSLLLSSENIYGQTPCEWGTQWHFSSLVFEVWKIFCCFQWSGTPGFNPRSNHTKDSKMVLDATLLKSQQYKVRIKGKMEQFREWSTAF